MDENKKIIRTGIIVVFALIVAVAAYYFFIAGKDKTKGGIEPALQSQKPAGVEPGAKDGMGLPALNLDLDKSDDSVRKLIADLSSNPTFAQWLKTKELIRKFVAAVDNIANGQSPRPQMDFFNLAGPFKVTAKDGKTLLAPAGYDRYNIVADVFDSVSPAGCARLYAGFKTLFQQAYGELGYPKEDFHQTLLRAIVEVLRTPVVEGPIVLEKKIMSFAMVDPKLEELNPAPKHLLRMGPENLQLIQAKLRELALALGFSERQLPKPAPYETDKR
ncbi:MAG: DUF3014 domain-containing protein [Candidatus Aminicenantes bacterium]|nr:DUF3014 domain-containing protein [Candidatus Aminicenantes bacterium]